MSVTEVVYRLQGHVISSIDLWNYGREMGGKTEFTVTVDGDPFYGEMVSNEEGTAAALYFFCKGRVTRHQVWSKAGQVAVYSKIDDAARAAAAKRRPRGMME